MPAKVYECAYNFPNGDDVAIDQYLRVKHNSGNVALAGVEDQDGLAASRCESTDEVCAIEPLEDGHVYQMVAAGAISANAEVYPAAAGKIDDTATGESLGTALEAASGDGSVIRVVYKGNRTGILPVAQEALSGAGAVGVDTYYTAWTTTGADAGTLADGSFVGQQKKIKLIVDGGDGTLTPVSLSGGTTITFADVGDYAILVWNGSAWVAVELGNDTDGATAPALA